MKKFIFSVIFCLAICGFTVAQSRLPELDKIKQIKLLESTREDVKRIFDGDKDFTVLDDASSYSTENLQVNIFYSGSNCSEEDQDWNVPEGRVIAIKIYFQKRFWAKDLAVDLSSLTKEDKYFTSSNEFPIYFDKSAGVKYEACNGKIISTELFPPKDRLPLLCNNRKEKRNFYEKERWSREKVKEPKWKGFVDYFANVSKLTLSSNKITANSDGGMLIDVFAEIEASMCVFDDFIFNYRVSGGKIVGEGDKVVWDLSGVKSGTYTITASVDPGCGVCGTTKTEFVVVKECPDCPQK